LPDLAITPLVDWFMQDPIEALGVIAWACFGVWALFYLDCSGKAEFVSDDEGGATDRPIRSFRSETF
jgi:hypothetical protein